MQMIQGNFCATAADLYIQFGGIPEAIEVWVLNDATPLTWKWAKSMGGNILTVEGIGIDNAGGAVLDFAFGEGITPYEGGDLLTTTNQTDVTYGGGIYIEPDTKDYRQYTNAAAGISGDAATTDLVTWTLDTAATPTGHFNGDVTGTYIGAGSPIRITSNDNKHTYDAYITALTAGQGVTADEVTLSRAVPSGRIDFIGGKFGFKPSTIGTVTKAGLMLNSFATDGDICGFVAWMRG